MLILLLFFVIETVGQEFSFRLRSGLRMSNVMKPIKYVKLSNFLNTKGVESSEHRLQNWIE